MTSDDSVLRLILSGKSDANIAFKDVCRFLEKSGFEERIRGSHHIFRKEGIEERINLQKDGNKARPYQIKQIRHILFKYHLGE